MAQGHIRAREALTEHTKTLSPLPLGTKVLIQNQTGNHPRRWDKTGVIVECRGHDQYLVKVDGSGRTTLRNRKYLRSFKPALNHSHLPLQGAPNLAPPVPTPRPHAAQKAVSKTGPGNPVRSLPPQEQLLPQGAPDAPHAKPGPQKTVTDTERETQGHRPTADFACDLSPQTPAPPPPVPTQPPASPAPPVLQLGDPSQPPASSQTAAPLSPSPTQPLASPLPAAPGTSWQPPDTAPANLQPESDTDVLTDSRLRRTRRPSKWFQSDVWDLSAKSTVCDQSSGSRSEDLV